MTHNLDSAPTAETTADLRELAEAYAQGRLAKADYIRAAHRRHQQLFEYVDRLAAADVRYIHITADGVRFRLGDAEMWCPPGEARVAPIEALNFGGYEPAETHLLDTLAARATHVLDIGANIGVHTLRLALRFPALRLYAFEPIPTSFDYLQRNIALNAVGERVRTFHCALADRNGATSLYLAPGNGTNASLRNVAAAADAVKVPGLTLKLDDWCRSYGVVPDLIKCDVEGGELAVFTGARDTLARARPMVVSELLRKWSRPFGYHPNDLLDLFAGLGYHCFAIGEAGIRPITRVDQDTPETNYAWVHPERHPEAMQALSAGRPWTP